MCSCDSIMVLHDRLSLEHFVLAKDLIRLEIAWVVQAHQLGSCFDKVTLLADLRLYLWVCAEVAGPVSGLVFERILAVRPEVCMVSLILNVFSFWLLKDSIEKLLHRWVLQHILPFVTIEDLRVEVLVELIDLLVKLLVSFVWLVGEVVTPHDQDVVCAVNCQLLLKVIVPTFRCIRDRLNYFISILVIVFVLMPFTILNQIARDEVWWIVVVK